MSETTARTDAPDAHAVRPDRMERLKTVPRLREEADTMKTLVRIYCKAHHPDAKKDAEGICPECRTFLDYALKRLACCPYGGEKPVCGICRIHCYKPAEREKAREIMRYSGPKLVFYNPVAAVKHLIRSKATPPEKPRNPNRSR